MKLNFLFYIILFFVPTGFWAQCTMANYLTAFRIPSSSYPYFIVSAGVTVSATTVNVPTLSDVAYVCGGNNYAGSTPAWWLNSATGVITLNFSAPVTNLTYLINGTNSTEVFYITSNTGAITLSNFCSVGYTSVGGTLTAGATAGLGSIITVNNPIGATQYVMTHNGLGSGSRVTLLDCLTVLPIELNSFSAKCNPNNIVDIQWKTITEKNNDFFTIERSMDAFNWQVIGEIDGAGTSAITHNYFFSDNKPIKGTIYYRLKQTDYNKQSTFSEIVSVINCSQSNNDNVAIYPNPSSSEVIISGSNIENIQIFNTLGTEVLNKKNANSDDIKINVINFPNGVYFLKIGEKNYKFIKE